MPASPLSADGDENSKADECSFDSESEVVISNALSVVNLLLSIFPTEFTAQHTSDASVNAVERALLKGASPRPSSEAAASANSCFAQR